MDENTDSDIDSDLDAVGDKMREIVHTPKSNHSFQPSRPQSSTHLPQSRPSSGKPMIKPASGKGLVSLTTVRDPINKPLFIGGLGFSKVVASCLQSAIETFPGYQGIPAEA